MNAVVCTCFLLLLSLCFVSAASSPSVELSFSSSPTKAAADDFVRTVTNLQTIEDAKEKTYGGDKYIFVKLTFDKSAAKPKSAFLHVNSTTGDRDAMFVLKPTGENLNIYSLKMSIGSSELIESLNGSGLYILSIFYGDSSMERLVRWKLATVNLNLPTTTRVNFDSHFTMKEPIAHTFRQPDSRPMAIVPIVFTLLVIAPFGGLIVALGSSGLTFQFPSNPTEWLYSLVFQCSILSILGSFTLYWLWLNIFQALALSAACGVVAVFSGTGALRLLHQRGKSKEKKAE